jgi:hypothetical protein
MYYLAIYRGELSAWGGLDAAELRAALSLGHSRIKKGHASKYASAIQPFPSTNSHYKTIFQGKLGAWGGLHAAELRATLAFDEVEDHVLELEQVDPLLGVRAS